MAIYIKKPELKRKVFKSIRYHENLAIKFYQKGDIIGGKRHEKKSDELYAKNYKKMFGIRKK